MKTLWSIIQYPVTPPYCNIYVDSMVCTNKDTLTAAGHNATEHAPDTTHPTGVMTDTWTATRVL